MVQKDIEEIKNLLFFMNYDIMITVIIIEKGIQ